MTIDRQTEIRDEFSTRLVSEWRDGRLTLAEAATVGMATSALILALIESPNDRRKTADILAKALPKHTEKRRAEFVKKIAN